MRSIIPGVNFPTLNPCWLSAPAERSVAFLPAFVRMSVAIQSLLRERVPVEYFQVSDRFCETRTAYPMLVYQASPPFRGKKHSELTYDVLNPALIAILFRRTRPRLTELLVQVENRLRGEGMPELADQYAPRRVVSILSSVQRLSKSRRYLGLLIRGESVLVDALVQLGGLGELPPQGQARRWASFGKRWNYQLRRLSPGRDYVDLVPDLLAAAADALQRETDQLHHGEPGLLVPGSSVPETIESGLPELQ